MNALDSNRYEQASKKYRIVRRIVLYSTAIVVVVPLWISGYVASYIGLNWALGRGTIRESTAQEVEFLFEPLSWYRSNGYYGSRWITKESVRAYWAGRREPIPDSYRTDDE